MASARSGRRATRRAALGFALLVALGCSEEAPPAEPVMRPVKIFEVGSGESGARREFPGQISPATNVELGFEVSGQIIEFPVIEGQEIAQGAVIARIDPRDYQADLDAAQATAASARAEHERRQKLFEEEVLSKQELERSLRNYEVTKANVASKQKAVDDTVLRAPFDGVIARKIATDFANVAAKEPIVQLQTGSALEIVVNVPERDFAAYRPGLSIAERNEMIDAHVVVSALPDSSMPARLKEFATSADPKTRTFRATLSFDRPPDVNVLPGMTAKVVVDFLHPGRVQEVRGGHLVPVGAVADDDGGKPYVWRVDPETMQVSQQDVTVGELTGASIVVTSGLEGGEWIAASGVHQLREGARVRRLDE